MKTRAQSDMERAATLVGKVSEESTGIQKIYGGLCHSFPILVRQCGLCQALAFSQAKAAGEGERARAHATLLKHVQEILGADVNICEGDTLTYMEQTRRVLSAWIYFKRFAVSLLKVESAQDADDKGVE